MSRVAACAWRAVAVVLVCGLAAAAADAAAADDVSVQQLPWQQADTEQLSGIPRDRVSRGAAATNSLDIHPIRAAATGAAEAETSVHTAASAHKAIGTNSGGQRSAARRTAALPMSDADNVNEHTGKQVESSDSAQQGASLEEDTAGSADAGGLAAAGSAAGAETAAAGGTVAAADADAGTGVSDKSSGSAAAADADADAAVGVGSKAAAGSAATTEPVAAAGKLRMQDCSNDDSGLPLAMLKVEASWESHGFREGFDMTLVTQMSPRRSRALKELCYVWGGVISAAVYVPLLQGVLFPEAGAPVDWAVPDVIRHLSAFHRKMETQGPCKLDMTLYSEEVESAAQAAFYPVNALRNRAFKQAKTEVVLLDDVDFIVSAGLSDPENYDAIVRRTRRGEAVVLPALEPADALGIRNGTRVALKAIEEGKAQAAAMYMKKRLKPFHIERWDLAHRATDYDAWATVSDFYDIKYEHDFEPYVMLARDRVPQYDERLRGYFENKAVHLRHMAATGLKFSVHPTAFVVHLPHAESKARLMLIDPANIDLRNKVQGLGTRIREWIDAGAYTPVTTESCTPQQQAAARRAAAMAAAGAAPVSGEAQAKAAAAADEDADADADAAGEQQEAAEALPRKRQPGGGGGSSSGRLGAADGEDSDSGAAGASGRHWRPRKRAGPETLQQESEGADLDGGAGAAAGSSAADAAQSRAAGSADAEAGSSGINQQAEPPAKRASSGGQAASGAAAGGDGSSALPSRKDAISAADESATLGLGELPGAGGVAAGVPSSGGSKSAGNGVAGQGSAKGAVPGGGSAADLLADKLNEV